MHEKGCFVETTSFGYTREMDIRTADTALGSARHRLLTRRHALTASLAACAFPAAFAHAKVMPTLRLGAVEITLLSDGHLVVPTPMLATNIEPGRLHDVTGSTAPRVEPPCNVTLVRTPRDLVLIDVGAGAHFMPTAGKLLANLEGLGVKREDVTKVVFTHAHPDHLWGALDDFDDSPMFPNAEHIIAAAELDFWTRDDVETRLPADRSFFARPTASILSKLKDRLRTIAPGQDIVPHLKALNTAGHTAGHIAVEITDGSQSAIVVGDALSHPVISFAHPDWTPAADHHDRDQAVATRKALLARLAADRSSVIGYHLPFPGIGTVQREGTAYRFEDAT